MHAWVYAHLLVCVCIMHAWMYAHLHVCVFVHMCMLKLQDDVVLFLSHSPSYTLRHGVSIEPKVCQYDSLLDHLLQEPVSSSSEH